MYFIFSYSNEAAPGDSRITRNYTHKNKKRNNIRQYHPAIGTANAQLSNCFVYPVHDLSTIYLL